MKILSLFDGISCGRVALERANIPVDVYYSSEIDPHAMQISRWNYPSIIQLGDIKEIKGEDFKDIDIIIGGSPCTSLSCAKRQKESGLEKGESVLFWEYLRVVKEVKPKYFLLENVASMKPIDRDNISKALWDVEPIMINSSLVSAQQRKRYYWVGKYNKELDIYKVVKISQPSNKNIYLKDILESNTYTEKLKAYCITATYSRACIPDYFNHAQRQLVFTKPVRVGTIGNGGQGERIYHVEGKSIALSAHGGGRGAKTGLYEFKDHIRKLTPLECERLQTLPDGYTEGISNAQRYKTIGNGWTVDVIVHIFKEIIKNF